MMKHNVFLPASSIIQRNGKLGLKPFTSYCLSLDLFRSSHKVVSRILVADQGLGC
jgi:hypothetical protein